MRRFPVQCTHYISHILGKGPAGIVKGIKHERGQALVNPLFSA
jgi:hypothetical protein